MQNLIPPNRPDVGQDSVSDNIDNVINSQVSLEVLGGLEVCPERGETRGRITLGMLQQQLQCRIGEGFVENVAQRPVEERLPVFPTRVKHRNDDVSDAAFAAQVWREIIDARRHQQPRDIAMQLRIGHHRLDFSGEPAFRAMRIPADIAELRIRLINENQHLHKCHQQPPQPFKDDICLPKPHTPNVFQHEDRNIQFASKSLKDKRLSASDGPADT